MIITIKDGVQWNTESEKQSDAAIQWYREEVQPLIDESTPQKDKYGRPYLWEVEIDGVKIVVERIYVSTSNSWAMEKDVITLKVA